MADNQRLTETTGPMVRGIAIGFAVASATVLTLRFYTRLVLLKNAGKDDWSMLVAGVLAILNSIATCFEVQYGMGTHSELVSMSESLEQLRFLLLSILSYNVALNVVKLSLLLQYRRIFSQKLVQQICFYTMIFVVIWACVQAVILGLACLPVGIIIPSMATKCLDTLPIWYISSGVSMGLDIFIFAIPLPPVYKLQLPKKQKLLVFGIFGIGFFVCVLSIYRMFTLRPAVFSTDPSWDNIGAAIWTIIELNTAIVCSSLPTLRPLIAKLLPGAGLSSAGGYAERTSYLRYGSKAGTASKRSNVIKSQNHMTGSFNTEELALKDLGESPSSSSPGVFVEISTNQARPQWSNGQHVTVRTETVQKSLSTKELVSKPGSTHSD